MKKIFWGFFVTFFTLVNVYAEGPTPGSAETLGVASDTKIRVLAAPISLEFVKEGGLLKFISSVGKEAEKKDELFSAYLDINLLKHLFTNFELINKGGKLIVSQIPAIAEYITREDIIATLDANGIAAIDKALAPSEPNIMKLPPNNFPEKIAELTKENELLKAENAKLTAQIAELQKPKQKEVITENPKKPNVTDSDKHNDGDNKPTVAESTKKPWWCFLTFGMAKKCQDASN